MVSERSGVSIGTVYRYWGNRVAMLDDIAPNREVGRLPEPDDAPSTNPSSITDHEEGSL
jgi:AcrR family transcriptional regulator